VARPKKKIFYKYKCTLSGKEYKCTRKAPNPDELVSLKAYYDLNPEEDDRPANIVRNLSYEEEDDQSFDSDSQFDNEEN